MFAKCARGCVAYLRREVESLGYKVLEESDTGVEIDASLKQAMELNLYLRTCQHLLVMLKRFSCKNVDDFYRQVSDIAWEEFIDPKEYISVVSSVDTRHVNNSMFVNQRAKDAICDRMVKSYSSRPDSGPKKDNIVISIHWKDDDCNVYLDTSGNKLSDRGYRKFPHSAPMQETLAAGLLMAANYDGTIPLVNPMCGSGTLAIEAALIASGRAPGLLRDNYAFMHLKGFDRANWDVLRQSLRKTIRDKQRAPIIASDIDAQAVEAAKKNAKLAGVSDMIQFLVCDFTQTPLPPGPGIVIMNPEYGIRLGDEKALMPVYKGIGDFFKQKCSGYRGYIFTGNAFLAKQVGLRTKRKLQFFNAQIECRLLEYELYEGTKKQR